MYPPSIDVWRLGSGLPRIGPGNMFMTDTLRGVASAELRRKTGAVCNIHVIHLPVRLASGGFVRAREE
jgi:hypothetical protein